MLNKTHLETPEGVKEEDVILTRESTESEQIKVHARRLRRRREFLGFSQSQLAAKFKAANPDIKLAQSDVSKWERSSGTTNKPRFAALARFLGVTENWLRGIGTVMTAEGRTEEEELELNGITALGEVDDRETATDDEGEESPEGEPASENPPAPAIFELGLRQRDPDPVPLPVAAPAPAPEPTPMADAGLGDIVALLQAEVTQQLAGVNVEAEGTRKAMKDGVRAVGESFTLCDIALTDLYEARRKDVSASIRSRITGVVAPRTSDAAKATALQMLGDLETSVIQVITALRLSIGEKSGSVVTARAAPVAPKVVEPPKVEVETPVAPVPEPAAVEEREEEEEAAPVEEPEDPPVDTPPEMVKVKVPPKRVLVIGGFHPPHDDVQNAALREHNIEIDWIQTDGKSTNQIDSAVKRISNPAKTVQGVIVVSGGFNHNFSTRVTYAAKMAGVPTAHANNQGPAQINRAVAKIASDLFPKTV